MSEAEFQKQIVELAQLRGWRVFHDHDSRRNAAGLPDLILVRSGRLIFAELKSEKGRVSEQQLDWLRDLDEVAESSLGKVLVDVWRPADWTTIEEELR